MDSLEEPTEEPLEDGERDDSDEVPLVIVNTDREFEVEPPEEIDPDVEVATFDLIEAFLDVAEQVSSHPATVQTSRECARPAPEFSIQTVEDGLGDLLPQDFKSFYRLCDGLELAWSWQQAGEVSFGGEIRLVGISTVFGHWFDELWIERDEMTDEERDFVWTTRGFDMPRHPDAVWTVVSFDESHDSFTLWAHRPGEAFLPLELGLIDYLYCAIEARGAAGWQLLFTDYDFDEDPWGVQAPGAWIDRLHAFFPDFDAEFFRQELGEV